MEKVILTVATTGSWGSKSDSPYIPLSPEEIAEEVVNCSAAGASLAHIHARDKEGNEAISTEIFSDIVERIREKDKDIILNLTTAGPPPHEKRMLHIKDIKPDMASFDCGSMNWLNKFVFENSPSFLESLGACMQNNNVKPEVEIFDTGMMYNALHYIKKGILKTPVHFQFVLGAPGGMKATVKNLLFLYEMLPENSTWSAFGIGKDHLPIMYAAMSLGATGIRVGMEDNLYYNKGVLAKSNVEFVERAVRVIKEFGKEPATPAKAREILNL